MLTKRVSAPLTPLASPQEMCMTVIRAANIADTPDVMALSALAIEESIGVHVQFHTMIERVRVAEVAGSVVGLVAVMPCAGFTYVLEFYVAKAHRRRGIGRALIERVIEDARIAGQREVRLHVHPDNHAVQALYASCGFVEKPGGYLSRAIGP
jgi:ribosomal protein S18 acetylase RimI-like enzyme